MTAAGWWRAGWPCCGAAGRCAGAASVGCAATRPRRAAGLEPRPSWRWENTGSTGCCWDRPNSGRPSGGWRRWRPRPLPVRRLRRWRRRLDNLRRRRRLRRGCYWRYCGRRRGRNFLGLAGLLRQLQPLPLPTNWWPNCCRIWRCPSNCSRSGRLCCSPICTVARRVCTKLPLRPPPPPLLTTGRTNRLGASRLRTAARTDWLPNPTGTDTLARRPFARVHRRNRIVQNTSSSFSKEICYVCKLFNHQSVGNNHTASTCDGCTFELRLHWSEESRALKMCEPYHSAMATGLGIVPNSRFRSERRRQLSKDSRRTYGTRVGVCW